MAKKWWANEIGISRESSVGISNPIADTRTILIFHT